MAAGKMGVFLMVGGLCMDRWAESKLVNIYVKIKESDMRGKDDPSKLDRIETVEMLKEKKKGTMAMGPQQENIINNPETKVRFKAF